MFSVVDLAPTSDGTLGAAQLRRPTTLFFAMAAGDLGAANTAGAPPSLMITETQLISVDLGHENMKVSAWRVQQQQQQQISHGEPAEEDVAAEATATLSVGSVSMLLNDQTNRKSPSCVAFRYFKDSTAAAGDGDRNSTRTSGLADGEAQPAHRRHAALHPRGYHLERTFAEQAQALAPRFPTQVVCSAAQLLGYTAAPANATTTEQNPYALTAEQLIKSYGYHVVPLMEAGAISIAAAEEADEAQQEQQQQQRYGVEGRQALGVYVPFFATSNATEEGGVLFSCEEVTAMLLGYARRMAEKADAVDNALSENDPQQQQHVADMQKSARAATAVVAASATRHVALTVPVHATVAQRQALVDAAALSGLRVVRLVHSTSAAALQLAYMKAEQVLRADKVIYVMIYDMGSQKSEVGIYRFAAPPTAMANRVKLPGGTIELQALVSSRTLGGAAFDECIASHWDARYFGNRVLRSVSAPVGGSEAERRVAAKERVSLLRAAQRTKEMLSANKEAHVTIDGVHTDPSYFDAAGQQELQQGRATVTEQGGLLSLRVLRGDFEEWCDSLFKEAVALRDEAIAATHGGVPNLSALDRFEVIGGGTRVPRLLQRLSEGYRDGVVDRTLNSDEAAALGTTLLAVSSAPPTLGLRGSQALPRHRLREWLTNAVYASVEVQSAATAAPTAPPDVHLLFPAVNTTLPAERSLRVRMPAAVDVGSVDSDVVVTLYSGAEADSAYALRKGTNASETPNPASVNALSASVANCGSCYVQTCAVEGVHKAAEQLLAQYTRHRGSAKRSHEHPRLAGAEVVVEVVATVSGIPHCSIAYLRAEIEEAVAANETPSNDVDDGDGGGGGGEAAAAGASPDTANSLPGEEGKEGGGQVEALHTGASMEDEGTPEPAPLSQPQPEVQVRVIALPLRVSKGIAAAGAPMHHHLRYNMNSEEMAYSHRRLQQLQAIDDEGLRRSILRNEIESVLLSIKEHYPTWDAEDVHVAGQPSSREGGGPQSDEPSPPSLLTWRRVVRKVSEWLDDFGDTASATALEEHLRIVVDVEKAIREGGEGGAEEREGGGRREGGLTRP
ncbi:hypothetical protein JKF63_07844 [Porcisia hertigi]|uniref:Uncharacterized protein n=1 Tax=Porcisia hertigi TaxID=2761500 RepID=A0A836LMF5_9TRYP|nr:hypothetical protein JKF63_07844 [Porcisia hertigi]